MAKETIASLKKQLEDANKRIEYICEAHEEELIKAGVKSRKTLMSDIEQIEKDARKTIEYTIAQCEKKTGRPLSQSVAFDIEAEPGKIITTAPIRKIATTQEERQILFRFKTFCKSAAANTSRNVHEVQVLIKDYLNS